MIDSGGGGRRPPGGEGPVPAQHVAKSRSGRGNQLQLVFRNEVRAVSPA